MNILLIIAYSLLAVLAVWAAYWFFKDPGHFLLLDNKYRMMVKIRDCYLKGQNAHPQDSEEEIIKVEASSTAKKIIDEGEEDFESYDPANFDLDLRDVRTYIQDGNLNAASELLIPMFKYSPSSYEVRLLLAIVRTRQGRPDEAIVALEDLRGTREDLPCLLALSGAYFAANRPHDAIFTLDKACKIAPQDPAPYMNLAYIFNTMKDNTKNAEVYYRAAIKRGATRDRNFEKTLGIKKW